ncbi:hypothetical protein CN306_18720 [Bacillus thuringiensis]|uniref:YopX family protein n=1 Tax=Bacillus thuringiensis TaxID=1428 RepID=UPI000BF5F594|nr:YopX family protein [Bacillus thuringiensis]PFD89206.1 hypothetical protein CN306_18720 [Bacillus thuringiensis]
MRAIECRGKDERGQWHYGYYVDGYMFDSMIGGLVAVPFIVQTQLNNPKRVVVETVGQYTGLLDKHGNKIFEGDIVEYNGWFYIIKWDKEDAGFYMHDKNNDEDDHLRTIDISVGEVMGNIYENQNLIK